MFRVDWGAMLIEDYGLEVFFWIFFSIKNWSVYTIIQRSTAREASVSRHHDGSNYGHF